LAIISFLQVAIRGLLTVFLSFLLLYTVRNSSITAKLGRLFQSVNFYRPKRPSRICNLGVLFGTSAPPLKRFFCLFSAYSCAKISYQTGKHLLRDTSQLRFRHFAKCYSIEDVQGASAEGNYYVHTFQGLVQFTIGHLS